MAFTGAPAQFPVQQHSVPLQKYLRWSDNIAAKRDAFIQKHIGSQKFVGIHLRLGGDFVSICCFRKVDKSVLLYLHFYAIEKGI